MDKTEKCTTIPVRESTAKYSRILQNRLGYHSKNDMVLDLLRLVRTMGWSRLDIQTLIRYRKLPEVEVSDSKEGAMQELSKTVDLLDFKFEEKFSESHPIKGEIKNE